MTRHVVFFVKLFACLLFGLCLFVPQHQAWAAPAQAAPAVAAPSLSPQEAKAAQDMVTEFYTWYITADKGAGQAIKDPDIERYVDARMLASLANPLIVDARDQRDYFLKSLDGPLSMKGVSLLPGEPRAFGYDKVLVPLRVSTEYDGTPQPYYDDILVVLQKSPQGLLVIDVMDMYSE